MTTKIVYYYIDGTSIPDVEIKNKELVYKRYYKDGNFHRLDGPAIEWANGEKEYWIEGKRHRLDGPAVEWRSGTKQYWVNGKCHRLDGPAVEYADGRKMYWVEGKLHRLDAPAIEYADGRKEYWVEGKLHRLDGPAIELKSTDGRKHKYYYVNNVDITDKIKSIKEEDIPKYLRMLAL